MNFNSTILDIILQSIVGFLVGLSGERVERIMRNIWRMCEFRSFYILILLLVLAVYFFFFYLGCTKKSPTARALLIGIIIAPFFWFRYADWILQCVDGTDGFGRGLCIGAGFHMSFFFAIFVFSASWSIPLFFYYLYEKSLPKDKRFYKYFASSPPILGATWIFIFMIYFIFAHFFQHNEKDKPYYPPIKVIEKRDWK